MESTRSGGEKPNRTRISRGNEQRFSHDRLGRSEEQGNGGAPSGLLRPSVRRDGHDGCVHCLIGNSTKKVLTPFWLSAQMRP